MSATFNITGRIGSIDRFENSTQVSVASDRRVKIDGEWKTITDWNRITLFRGLAQYAHNHLGKGDLIQSQGRTALGSYEKHGETIYVTNFVTEKLERLSQAEANRADRETTSRRA